MIQAPTPPVPPVPPLDPNLIFLSGGPGSDLIMLTLVLLTAIIILWPVMRALGRRLEGKTADPALEAEVERLRQRVEEMDALQARMAELEERVDFTERVLVRGQDGQPSTARLERP
jgi:hypothetical protein